MSTKDKAEIVAYQLLFGGAILMICSGISEYYILGLIGGASVGVGGLLIIITNTLMK